MRGRAARGRVIRGSRNRFTVKTGTGTELECTIKGKILKGVEGFYNPLAPGDWVLFEEDAANPGYGNILELEERRNAFTRFNKKGFGRRSSAAVQLIAANVDLVCCVSSPASPPFRPRFIDRVLLQGAAAGIETLIILNKDDLCAGDSGDEELDREERLSDFVRIGYPLVRVSALNGKGIRELREYLRGKLSVLVGQSGVGKSSLVNALNPLLNQRVGALNEKYDRGNHVTTMARLLEIPDSTGNTYVIDSPGLRQIIPDGVSRDDVILFMNEFAPLAGLCSYGHSCSHISEPGCKIMEGVDAGAIHEDRYESFLRIRQELLEIDNASAYE